MKKNNMPILIPIIIFIITLASGPISFFVFSSSHYVKEYYEFGHYKVLWVFFIPLGLSLSALVYAIVTKKINKLYLLNLIGGIIGTISMSISLYMFGIRFPETKPIYNLNLLDDFSNKTQTNYLKTNDFVCCSFKNIKEINYYSRGHLTGDMEEVIENFPWLDYVPSYMKEYVPPVDVSYNYCLFYVEEQDVYNPKNNNLKDKTIYFLSFRKVDLRFDIYKKAIIS